MSKVSIVKCGDYNPVRVEESVGKALKLLGGLEKIVKEGDKVLLKLNLTNAEEPGKAATTHPQVVRALVRAVKECGGIPMLGDSSDSLSIVEDKCREAIEKFGWDRWQKICLRGKTWPELLRELSLNKETIPNIIKEAYDYLLKITGMKEVLDEFEVLAADFEEDYRVSNNLEGRFLHSIVLAKVVMEADVLISIPKLKTHNQALFTGCIKNSFGCVPGPIKSRYHRLSVEKGKFASMLLDVFVRTKPNLSIMDGIIGMEGEGPGAGSPRKVGIVLASEDSVALDAVASTVIGYVPLQIPTIRIASQRRLGEANLEKIEIMGEGIEEVRIDDFIHPAKRELVEKAHRNE